MTDDTQPKEPQPAHHPLLPRKLAATLFATPKRAAVAGVVGSSVIWAGTFAAEVIATKVLEIVDPDEYEIQAEAVRSHLSEKTDAINSLAGRMAEDLAELRDGAADPAALEGFLLKAERLMQRTEELQPAVTRASDFSSQLARADAASKAAEIDRRGYSARADITLREDEGFELCGERFFFSVSRWNTGSNILIAEIAFREETKEDRGFKAGETLSIQGNATQATVAYSGVVGEGEDRRLGFNVACDPIPAPEVPA